MRLRSTNNRISRHLSGGKKRKSCCFFQLGVLNFCHWCLVVIWQCITTCHTCQIRGKPNQLCIRLAPLPPNLAIEQPFQYISVDNVGPWPHLYSGEQHYSRALIHCNVSDYQISFCVGDPERSGLNFLLSYLEEYLTSVCLLPQNLWSDFQPNLKLSAASVLWCRKTGTTKEPASGNALAIPQEYGGSWIRWWRFTLEDIYSKRPFDLFWAFAQ